MAGLVTLLHPLSASNSFLLSLRPKTVIKSCTAVYFEDFQFIIIRFLILMKKWGIDPCVHTVRVFTKSRGNRRSSSDTSVASALGSTVARPTWRSILLLHILPQSSLECTHVLYAVPLSPQEAAGMSWECRCSLGYYFFWIWQIAFSLLIPIMM